MTIPIATTRGYAWYALLVLTFINGVNYMDRYVLAAVVEQIQAPPAQGGLGLDDDQFGSLTAIFFLAYVLSPLSGYLGDRMQRRKLLAVGIFLWSVATVASAFVTSYGQLLAARALTGIGETTYGIIAPAFLADLFDKNSRSRTLSVFYVALPVGTAAGYVLGGWIGEHYGWRNAFLVGGAPGLVLSILAWFLVEPARGGKDGAGHSFTGKLRPGAIRELFQNRAFRINVAATTAMTFAIGGLGNWIPAFLQRVHGYGTAEANALFGIMVSAAGIFGTIAGGIFADWVLRFTRTAHFLIPGITLMLSAIALTFTILTGDRIMFWFLGSVSVFLLFSNSGPLNAAIVNSTMPDVRSTAFSMMILIMHMLGDALSPKLIGLVSKHGSGSPGENLRNAFLIMPPLVLLAGLLLLVFRKRLPQAVDLVEQRLAAMGPGAGTPPAAFGPH